MDAIVADILRIKGDHVYVVDPRAPVLEAVHIMNAHAVGCVLVVDGEEVLGIVAERDIVGHLLAEGRDAASAIAADVMSRPSLVAGEPE